MAYIYTYPDTLLPATLIKRYKRFLADVRLQDGSEINVHCANSGAMTSCNEPGRPVLISDSGNPKRKLRYSLEQIHMGRAWVGVNTSIPNRAVLEGLRSAAIPGFEPWDSFKPEVKYGVDGKSRIDVLATDSRGTTPPCYIEVKNTTMAVGEHCAFPDAVTERGLKHLRELASVVAAGQRALMFYFVGRADCTRFRPADEVDPAYGKALREVLKQGVEAVAWRMRYDERGVELLDQLPIDLA